MREILAGSVQYVLVPVITAVEFGVDIDPTSDTVLMTFWEKETLPPDPNWETADWVATTDTQGNRHFYARILVGPTAYALDPGIWWPFVLITTSDESPQLRAAQPILIRAISAA